MLEMSKKITLDGVVKIQGEPVVYLNASINSSSGYGANINRSIVNQELYLANKTAIRADINEFEDAVYEIEDEVTATPTQLEESK